MKPNVHISHVHIVAKKRQHSISALSADLLERYFLNEYSQYIRMCFTYTSYLRSTIYILHGSCYSSFTRKAIIRECVLHEAILIEIDEKIEDSTVKGVLLKIYYVHVEFDLKAVKRLTNNYTYYGVLVSYYGRKLCWQLIKKQMFQVRKYRSGKGFLQHALAGLSQVSL